MTLWRKAWIVWSLLGLGSLFAILAAKELGAVITPRVWGVWVAGGLGSFTILEVWGLIRVGNDDTFSDQVWALGTARSIVIFACLWGAFALSTGNVWPSFGAFALAWCAWHFWREGPYAQQ